jgi:NTP pyrophosphatase (non-canonical NTP hydrolase)
MDNELREILIILQEECNEVAKEICKIMRYGPDQIKPGTDFTNIQHLERELGDLLAMVELLQDKNVGITLKGMNKAKKKKFEKLKQWSNLTINK